MRSPAWVCTLDETPASAAFGAALLGLSSGIGEEHGLELELVGDRRATLERLVRTCARRGLAAELRGDALTLAGRSVALHPSGAGTTRARLRERRVELERDGKLEPGERAELLAAAALFEAFERGGQLGLRWGLLSTIEGRDEWSAGVDLCERKPEARLDAMLSRWFPSVVGRVTHSAAVGPQLGAVVQLCVVLGAGASVESVRDLLAAQADDPRSRWPKLRARAGFGSADCLGDAGVSLDVDAIASAGPLVRITGYFDPPAVLAGDLLRRLSARSQP